MMHSITYSICVTNKMFPLFLPWDDVHLAELVLNWFLLVLWGSSITVEQRQVKEDVIFV